MSKSHYYKTTMLWTGNRGAGTFSYTAYDRSHIIKVEGKPEIQGSSDPGFRGDPSMFNPEELFVSSLSSCHMLWYLHLCAVKGIIVMEYADNAEGIMKEDADGSGRFTEVTLNPVVTVTEERMVEVAKSLHEQAHKMCFIANSVNFTVKNNPVIQVLKAR